jgi:thiol-disulfide isomerase/thioredoxin
LAPATGLLASLLAPVPAGAALPAGTVDATARAAVTFAAGDLLAGTVPASSASLAQGIIQTMLSAKLKVMAFGAVVLLAAGTGAGLSFSSPPRPRAGEGAPQVQAEGGSSRAQPSPAEQYLALVRRYQDDLQAYQAAATGKSPEETREIYQRLAPDLAAYATRFVSLAERYPRDPAAADAAIWVVEQTLSASDQWETPFSLMVGRAMEILTRDHAADPRLGHMCLQLIGYDSSRREKFLRAIAERSPNRNVKGQATLALAEYLGIKAANVEMIQHPDAPENLEKMKALITSIFGPEALASTNPPITDARAILHRQREELDQHAPEYLQHLLAADPAAIRRESEQLYGRVIREFGDVPHFRLDTRPTRETLADVARRSTRPGPATSPPGLSFRALDEAFRAAAKAADAAADKLGPGEAGMRAFMAAAPRWTDYGPKMWKLAEENPRHPDTFEALLWLIEFRPVFDAAEERAAITGKAVDALIRDHLDTIAADLAARNVAEAFGMGGAMPGPHRDRLFRALYERSKSREARGRMGLLLARTFKAEAELAESLATRGADPGRRPELALWPPSYLERLRKEDTRAIRREAEAILERVKSEYGDVRNLYGMVVQDETLAKVADRELADLRTLAIGQVAPEIVGQDLDGKPMKLSEFRGRVVLLDFGSHEHCGACRLVYPRLRNLIDRYRNRPFVVLGIQNNDRREVLRDLASRGEITWRCWWDGDRPDGPGPITTRWNVGGYPTFIVLDHDGKIRFKDLHPLDERSFDVAIEALVKRAEAGASRR